MGRPKKWVRPFSQASTTMDWPPRLWPFSPEMAWSQNWMVELVEVQKMMGKNIQKLLVLRMILPGHIMKFQLYREV